MEERLQKILARAGVASRRGAEQLIKAGRVRVNGQVVDQLGCRADTAHDRIEVDGQWVGSAEKKQYFLFYKPTGYLTTLNDPRDRPTIARFLEDFPVRLFPVGRLDRDTEGLLILTNDGELASRLMHPRFHVPKQYRVKVRGHPSADDLERLSSGEMVLGERAVAPAEVEVVKEGKDRTWLLLTLFEGRRRQVRRMCSMIGHPVLKLKRTSYGPLLLGRLKPGEIRPLHPAEVQALAKAAGMTGEEDPQSLWNRGGSLRTEKTGRRRIKRTRR